MDDAVIGYKGRTHLLWGLEAVVPTKTDGFVSLLLAFGYLTEEVFGIFLFDLSHPLLVQECIHGIAFQKLGMDGGTGRF